MANYKIEEIQGIGPTYGEKLHQAGVKSTDAILKKGCDRKGRRSWPRPPVWTLR
jgi:hypothetical protein